MITRDIKAFALAIAIGAFALTGLSACNTGTDPGDTNRERSGIRKEGSMVEGSSKDPMGQYRDTTDMEKHYDHAKSKSKKASAVHEGTGKKGGVERDDVDDQ